MPFSFAFVGLYVDVNAMSSAGWSGLGPLFAITMTGYVSKFLGTLITSAFFELPIRDGLVLSFIMILRGQVEIVVFLHWMDKKVTSLAYHKWLKSHMPSIFYLIFFDNLTKQMI